MGVTNYLEGNWGKAKEKLEKVLVRFSLAALGQWMPRYTHPQQLPVVTHTSGSSQ